jgi:hypothetical protein
MPRVMLQRRVRVEVNQPVRARAEASELFSPVKKSMISQWDQVVQRHAPRAEIAITAHTGGITGNIREISRKTFSTPAISMHWLSKVHLKQE